MASSSSCLQREILISVSCLHDLPSSIITGLVIGTAVRLRDLRLGAKYPILLMRSLDMSFL